MANELNANCASIAVVVFGVRVGSGVLRLECADPTNEGSDRFLVYKFCGESPCDGEEVEGAAIRPGLSGESVLATLMRRGREDCASLLAGGESVRRGQDRDGSDGDRARVAAAAAALFGNCRGVLVALRSVCVLRTRGRVIPPRSAGAS